MLPDAGLAILRQPELGVAHRDLDARLLTEPAGIEREVAVGRVWRDSEIAVARAQGRRGGGGKADRPPARRRTASAIGTLTVDHADPEVSEPIDSADGPAIAPASRSFTLGVPRTTESLAAATRTPR